MLKKKKIKIITIGVAFSFQKYNKLPITKTDVELDYILTEKGLKNMNILVLGDIMGPSGEKFLKIIYKKNNKGKESRFYNS